MIDKNKNIVDIVPILSEDFIDTELSIDRIRDYKQFYTSNSHKLGKLSKYLMNQMHDCEILRTRFAEDSIEIEVNDINYFLKIEHDYPELKFGEQEYPFKIQITNYSEFSVHEVNEKGELIEIDNPNIVGAEILYDQLIKLDESKIDLGITLWKESKKHNNYLLLLISAEKISIEENQEKNIKKLINGNP